MSTYAIKSQFMNRVNLYLNIFKTLTLYMTNGYLKYFYIITDYLKL